MKDEKDPVVLKPPYKKPELVFLNRMATGWGQCQAGSGDQTYCTAGFMAAGDGCLDGNAAVSCNIGNSVI